MKIHGAEFSKEGLHPSAALQRKPDVTLKEGIMMRSWKPLEEYLLSKMAPCLATHIILHAYY